MQTLNYGVIGNCTTAALVSEIGSLDWCCLPHFAAPSAFAKILDENKGGSFGIEPDGNYEITQKYILDTNILVTNFRDGEDCFEVYDFMPRYRTPEQDYYMPPDVIRYIKWISGSPKAKFIYDPKLNYAFPGTTTYKTDEYIKSYIDNERYESIYLYTDVDFDTVLNHETITIEKDLFFLISYNEKLLLQDVERVRLKFERTKVYWLNWASRLPKYKKYDEQITRSALILKLLTYQETGAVLAALTTSLPETIGEVRNWDYRFCWIRDASMIVRVLKSINCLSTAQRFLEFVVDIIPNKAEKIQIMYGIHGEKLLTEQILEHLEGYEKSKPVRIGNAAYFQKQNDIYGVLMDVIYQNFETYHLTLNKSEDFWTIVRSLMRVVRRDWQEPDKGIWEIRNSQYHFTYSKVLCWTAADRGVKIANLLGRKEYAEKWAVLRDEIKADIMENGWNEEVGAFTQSYGSTELDAANLLFESYGFIKADDPKFVSTVKAIQKELSHKGLMYRYKNQDDFGEPSSSFTICTFWMIHALYRIGEKEEAEKLFGELLSYSNHLGLFSEDLDFETKRLLGNFPQGYSHLALIETAMMMSGGRTVEHKVLQAIW